MCNHINIMVLYIFARLGHEDTRYIVEIIITSLRFLKYLWDHSVFCCRRNFRNPKQAKFQHFCWSRKVKYMEFCIGCCLREPMYWFCNQALSTVGQECFQLSIITGKERRAMTMTLLNLALYGLLYHAFILHSRYLVYFDKISHFLLHCQCCLVRLPCGHILLYFLLMIYFPF